MVSENTQTRKNAPRSFHTLSVRSLTAAYAAFDAAYHDDETGAIQISEFANLSVPHMIILKRNRDPGRGSLCPLGHKHGSIVNIVASLMTVVDEVQLGATSLDVAAIACYVLRSVESRAGV